MKMERMRTEKTTRPDSDETDGGCVLCWRRWSFIFFADDVWRRLIPLASAICQLIIGVFEYSEYFVCERDLNINTRGDRVKIPESGDRTFVSRLSTPFCIANISRRHEICDSLFVARLRCASLRRWTVTNVSWFRLEFGQRTSSAAALLHLNVFDVARIGHWITIFSLLAKILITRTSAMICWSRIATLLKINRTVKARKKKETDISIHRMSSLHKSHGDCVFLVVLWCWNIFFWK